MSGSVDDRVFAYIRDYIEAHGHSPKLVEIGHEFGFSTPRASAVTDRLVRQGRLNKDSRRRGDLFSIPGRIDLRPVGTEALRAELARRGVTFDALAEPRPLHGGKPCAAHGCFTRVERGKLFCRDHWYAIEASTRSAILNAWRARDMQAYGEAIEAARDQIGGFTRVVERVA